MVVAQYYNFLRLGKTGYKKIMQNMMAVSNFLVEKVKSTGVFEVLGKRRMLPVMTVTLKETSKYTAFDISEKLRIRGWVVPAYQMPENAQDIAILRVVVKENMSMILASDFFEDLQEVLEELDKGTTKKHKPTSGKNKTH